MGILSSFNKLIKSHSARMIWYRVAIVISSLAIFVTTYLLMLPASTTTGATEITKLGNGVQKAITYDKDGKLRINVNNIYRIDAYLGADAWCGGEHDHYNQSGLIDGVLNNASNNTVLIRLRYPDGRDPGRNLGKYLFADLNQGMSIDEFKPWYIRGPVGTSVANYRKNNDYHGNIDFSHWIAIRVECYKASQYDASLRNGGSAYEYYSVQQVFGTVDKEQPNYEDDMVKKLSLSNSTEKGFILLVRKSFINAPTTLYSGDVTQMYIPQAGYLNGGAGYDVLGAGLQYYNDNVYEPGRDCLVDFNQEPFARRLTGSAGATDPMYDGIYSTYSGDQGTINGSSVGDGGQNRIGFVTFSLWKDQLDSKNSGALKNDKEAVNDIKFKLFDYSESINMSKDNAELTNEADKDNIRTIAPFYSFRYNGNFYADFGRNTYRPQLFWWNNYTPCNCTNIIRGTCHHAESNRDTGKASYLHNPVHPADEESPNDRRYDIEAFHKYHSTVEYNLVNGYPVLDFTRDANYQPVPEYFLSDTANASGYYPFSVTSGKFAGAAPSNNYNLTAEERSLAYLFGGVGDHAVTVYNPTNSILQYDESTGRYHYNSAQNAIDYDKENNVFHVRDYVESGEFGALDSKQTFDFFPFNYGGGYVTGTEFKNGTLREKTFNDSAILENASSSVWNDTDASTVRYNNINYWFGMTMEFNFTQNKDGQHIIKNEKGEIVSRTDMLFTFSGDDDVWVFIDDVLVLDLGGTHSIVDGSINFATGQISQAFGTQASKTYTTTLYDCFERAGKIVKNEDGSPKGWKKVGSTKRSGDTYIFEDYSIHNLKFFYTERGGYVANNSIEFFMSTFADNSLLVEKQVESKTNYLELNKDQQDYSFRVLRSDKDGNLMTNGNDYISLFKENDSFVIRSYDDDGAQVDIPSSVGANGIFKLKHGQTAIFDKMFERTTTATDNEVKYYVVQEILPNGQVYQYTVSSSLNGKNNNLLVNKGATDTTYTSDGAGSTAETNHVKFTNTVNAQHSIEIIKNLDLAGFGSTGDYGAGLTANSEFDIQVKINNVLLPVGTEYYVYNLNSEGAVIDGTERSATVATEGIVKIKNKQKVVIKGLLEGTKFDVKEIFDGVVKGYIITYTPVVNTGSGNCTTTSNGVSGTLTKPNSSDTTAAVVTITINNTRNGVTTKIPLSKELANSKQLSGSPSFVFNFKLEEILSNNPKAELSTSTINNGSITFTFDGAPSSKNFSDSDVFTLIYPDNFEVGTVTKYYRIQELEPADKLSFVSYDKSIYVLAVSITKANDGKLSLAQSLIKYDNANDKSGVVISGNNPTASFVNTIDLYNLPTTGANIFLNTRTFVLIGSMILLGGLLAVAVFVKKRKNAKV